MKRLFLLPLLASIVAAGADFSGEYTLNPPTNGMYFFALGNDYNHFGNWVEYVGARGVTIDTTLAPQSLRLSVDAPMIPWNGYLEIVAPATGQINFGYLVDGSNTGSFYWYYYDSTEVQHQTIETNLVSTLTQTSFPVYAGHRFGFGVTAYYTGFYPDYGSVRNATITDFTFSSVAQPSLKASMTSSNTVVIAWPSPSAGWVLQVNTNMAATNWSDVPTTPADNGTTRSVTFNSTGCQIFRLRQ